MKRFIKLICAAFFFLMVAGHSAIIHAQTEEEKIVAFSKESDWKLIRDAHFDIMDKLVSSRTDLSTVNFNDEAGFLSLIRMSKTQYLAKVDQVRAAAQRLTRKYGITASCDVCSAGTDLTDRFKSLVASYQRNQSSYNQYRMEVTGLGGLDEGGVRCCGWRFYLCCTVCAGTIAAFPAYLACCALCFDTYCCKP